MPTLSGICRAPDGSYSSRLVRVYVGDSGQFVGCCLSNASDGTWSVTTESTAKHFAVEHDYGGYPIFGDAKLLLHGNGSNNGTTITDETGKTPTRTGVVTSTDQSVFNGSSLKFANANDRIAYAAGTDWQIGTGDFSFSAFVRKSSNNANTSRLFQIADGDVYSGFSISINASGNLEVYSSSNGSSWNVLSAAGSTALSNDTWYWICCERYKGTFWLQVNTTISAIGYNTASLIWNSGWTPVIGGQSGTNRSLVGYMAEVEFFKRARFYGRAVSVPTSPFANAASGSPTYNAMIYDNLTPA